MFTYEKQMAHCSVGYRHPYLHRQCLRLELLTKPIMQAMGFTLKETTWTFSIAILFLGLSAGFLGDYVEKYGPRKSGLTSTCFFGLGMFGTALALHLNSLPLLYLFYGVIGGIGLGTGYITLFRRWSNGFPTTAALPPVLLSWVSVLPA